MRRARGGILALVAVLATGTVAACDITEPEDGIRGELERNRTRWAERGPVDYTYVLRRLCFCGPESLGPYRVRVEDDSVVAVTELEGGETVDPTFARFFVSVDGLFEALDDALERDAHRIDVTYDPALGYPTEIFIDYKENVADEELGYRARDLTALP